MTGHTQLATTRRDRFLEAAQRNCSPSSKRSESFARRTGRSDPSNYKSALQGASRETSLAGERQHVIWPIPCARLDAGTTFKLAGSCWRVFCAILLYRPGLYHRLRETVAGQRLLGARSLQVVEDQGATPIPIPIPMITSDMTITSTSNVSHAGKRFADWVIALCPLRSTLSTGWPILAMNEFTCVRRPPSAIGHASASEPGSRHREA